MPARDAFNSLTAILRKHNAAHPGLVDAIELKLRLDTALQNVATLQAELRLQSPGHHRQDGECVPDCEACRIAKVIKATS